MADLRTTASSYNVVIAWLELLERKWSDLALEPPDDPEECENFIEELAAEGVREANL